MYIPVSYWQTQGGGTPHVKGNYFIPSAAVGTTVLNYTFDNLPVSRSIQGQRILYPVCKDIANQNDVYRKYQEAVPAGAFFFCSANAPSGTININTPPNTGPEARYITVSYNGGEPLPSDKGTYYYSYVNEKGAIVNDTLVFGQTKTIIAQGPPIFMQQYAANTDFRIDYTIGEEFPGQTIPFPYTDELVDVTFQLKRTNTGGSTYEMPAFRFRERTLINGFPVITNSGSTVSIVTPSSLNATTTLGTYGIPLPEMSNAGSSVIVPCTWITNITLQSKGALLLTSCLTTQSVWVTLNNYDYYPTGSVLKVNTPALVNTSSCWTVSNVSSSAAVSVGVSNVEISQSYAAGFCANCLGFATEVIATGGTTGSFLSGSTLYRYNSFTTSGSFSILTGSIPDGKLLVIAGGGGGGNSAGGGAGGLVYSSSISLPSGSSYNITVGTGGVAYTGTLFTQATNGTDSTFSGSGYNVIAIGGGRGAGYTAFAPTSTTNGGDGGSGGGGNFSGNAGQGTAGQGNQGGQYGTISGNNWSGGGGGAGSAGSTRFGGTGLEYGSVMFNVSASYCVGGGSSGGSSTSTSGSGGKGGGGASAGEAGKNGLVVITYPAFI
jgi:hypothetical protein